MIELVLVVLLVLCLFGAPYGYTRRVDWGYGPSGILSVLLVVILVVLLMRVL